MMKWFSVPALAVMLASPAHSDEGDTQEGLSLMEEGARLLLQGLLDEMEPALDEMRDFAVEAGPALQSFLLEFGPALGALLDDVEDITAYHPPEMLPNGDIILRKKLPSERAPDDEGDRSGEVDL